MMSTNKIVCGKCHSEHYTQEEMKDSLGRRKIKASCAKCGNYIKFLPTITNIEEFELPFGKYKGEALVDVPRDYLEWMSNNFDDGPVLKKINQFLYGSDR